MRTTEQTRKKKKKPNAQITYEVSLLLPTPIKSRCKPQYPNANLQEFRKISNVATVQDK